MDIESVPIAEERKLDLTRAKSKDTISIDDFLLLCVIGKGSYAKVFLVRKKDTQEIFALKVLKKDYVAQRNQKDHVQTERYVLVDRYFPSPIDKLGLLGERHTPFHNKDEICLPKRAEVILCA